MTKEIKEKYWCGYCKRVHKPGIFEKHKKFKEDISDYEITRQQFKKNWQKAKKEQEEFGAVNLPRKK